eukprot:6621237-Prymnesium_polylepis.1
MREARPASPAGARRHLRPRSSHLSPLISFVARPRHRGPGMLFALARKVAIGFIFDGPRGGALQITGVRAGASSGGQGGDGARR